ncbi:Starch-binding associating with outer membrane [Chitinophaga sp. CF118]|uniref:SusD/RagB family nutrient-binding outer membrane lipoprotein n=1 Tax=Chitinophaga sp. CF118 TaxID=1884367 RepID=UPI0008F0313B|nr:SusD/RagB family nutrient-binding outer membrane lipoprotein [Chitinophaga sp. CF118]SFD88497.1 Starch-binding associating with outer membrane [Chitinophaga sp. CF118]
MRQHIKNIISAVPLVIMVASCNKLSDFGNTNVDPGSTTTPLVGALLTNVEQNLGGSYATSTSGGLFCQYFSETQYPGTGLYASSSLQASFAGNYSSYLEDLQNIITTNTSNNENAVARILKSYIYWNLTDRWGDLPYSEALKGNGTPVYDTQEEIYKGCIQELTDAIAQFDAGTSLITGDIIYSGDVASWKKLANSIRMLMALRLTKKYPAASDYAATQFKAALADAAGYITLNTENFSLTYPGDGYKSPWYSLYDGRKDVGESATMVSLLGSLNDSRQDAYGSSTTGVPYGLERSDIETWANANTGWARILAESYRPAAGGVVVLVTASQIAFARAEAADRGWTTETALTLYQDGINLSFAQWGLSAPAASYFTQSAVAFSAAQGTGANLQQIAIQRYIATYPNGNEGWAEWRRTGYPALTPAVAATNTSKEIPRRYTYASTEYSSNSVNVTAAAARLSGGDSQDSKIWWDQ